MIGLIIVGLDEYTQSAAGIGREFSVADIGAGALGVGAAASIAGVWDRPRRRDAGDAHARRDAALDVAMASPSTWFLSVAIGAASIGVISTAIWCVLWFGAGISNSNVALLAGFALGCILAWRWVISPRFDAATGGEPTPLILPSVAQVMAAWRHHVLLCIALLVVAVIGTGLSMTALGPSAAPLAGSVVLFIAVQLLIWCWWIVDRLQDDAT
jgi:hypothetical protein